VAKALFSFWFYDCIFLRRTPNYSAPRNHRNRPSFHPRKKLDKQKKRGMFGSLVLFVSRFAQKQNERIANKMNESQTK
jgi:hypothetical protein